MERNFSYEKFPGLDPEREIEGGERERSPELEPSPEDLLDAFESGKRFDDEDEKARDYNARLDQADEFQKEVDVISEEISQKTGLLAALPLTYDQQVLLDMIEKLIVQRKATKDAAERARFDELIKTKTEELAELPVTSEQGELLDNILELIDAREAAGVKLREIFGDSNGLA